MILEGPLRMNPLKFAIRTLVRQPTFALTAIFTLAIGMGATTAVFSVVEHELWKPLPFPHPDRLVAIFVTGPGARTSYDRASGPELADWRAQSAAFDELAAYRGPSRRILKHAGVSQSITVMPVTSNFFRTLGRVPAQGRLFDASDGTQPGVAVLSDAGYRRVFGTEASVVGTSVTVDDRQFAVVGVDAVEPLEFVPTPDLFVVSDPDAAGAGDRKTRDYRVVARLKSGVTRAMAHADLDAVTRRLSRQHPEHHLGRGIAIEGLRETYTGWNWRPLYFLLGAALFVLILTCANVANLLLARTLAREREFAIRRALGGGQAVLTRQLLLEGAVVAVPGACAGLLLATWAIGALPAWLPPDYLAREGAISLDARVYLFALALSGITTMAVGLAPVLLTRNRNLNPLLAQSGRSGSGPPSHRRARNALVVLEVTSAVVLLVGAGLFLNSFLKLKSVPLGFDPRARLTMRVAVSGDRYAQPEAIVRFSEQVMERTSAIPGVRQVAVASSVPLASGPVTRFVRGDRPHPSAGEESRAVTRTVSPGYFESLGIRMLRGRDFTERDRPGAPPIAIVNETLATRIFPGENAIGRPLTIMTASVPWVKRETVTIVGVVSNVKNVGVNEVEFNDIYVPFAQTPVASLLLVIRSDVPPDTLTDTLRHEVAALDADIPLFGITTMAQRVDEALEADRFHMLLIGAFASVAIILAAIGVYGVMAFAVEQRTREFGVRQALGARRARIFGLALWQSARLGLMGTALGLLCSLLLARILGNALFLVPGEHTGLLYGVSLTDPVTLAAACTVLMVVAAIAGLVPARRATRVDPAIALRCE
jgi:putative ABC transport system permease protein